MIAPHPALFAIAVVLAGAVAGSGDYELVLTPPASAQPICAKSRDACEAARQAIANGWMPEISRLSKTECIAHPNCFDRASNFIRGFNMPEGLR